MKPRHYLLIAAAFLAMGGWFFWHALPRFSNTWFSSTRFSNKAEPGTGWQAVDRAADGFKAEFPGTAKEAIAPAFNETGGTEAVHLLEASSVMGTDQAATYAVSWEDDPPVVRVNEEDPDRILEAARDGMLFRTATRLDSESRIQLGSSNVATGYPGRDITAHNSGGGVLNARLILAGQRLYTLMAMFPSEKARREGDVKRFYQSFAVTTGTGKAGAAHMPVAEGR